MSLIDQRFIAFDVETTGLKPYDNDKIIEFGAVEFKISPSGEMILIKEYSWLIDPERDLPENIYNITGIHAYMLHNKPKFCELAEELDFLFNGAIVIAHNLVFDLSFLTKEFRDVGMGWSCTIAEIDTLLLSRKFLQKRNNGLGFIAKELGVKLLNAHRAKDDAMACAQVFVEMVKQYRAPTDMKQFYRWSEAITPPPLNEYIKQMPQGLCFVSGPYSGDLIQVHPEHLQWMKIAKLFENGTWKHKFTEELRTWISNWLRIRAGGTFKDRKQPKRKAAEWQSEPALEVR